MLNQLMLTWNFLKFFKTNNSYVSSNIFSINIPAGSETGPELRELEEEVREPEARRGAGSDAVHGEVEEESAGADHD